MADHVITANYTEAEYYLDKAFKIDPKNKLLKIYLQKLILKENNK